MNNKKKMVLGAAFIVAIMALAGIGYAAATSFQGTTTSDTAEYDVDYVVVTLGHDGYVAPANVHVVYNSDSVANADATVITTTYTPVTHNDTITYKVVVEDSGDDDDALELKVKLASAFTSTDGYTLEVTYNGNTVNVTTSDVSLSTDRDVILTDGGVDFTVKVKAPTGGITKTDGTLPESTVEIPAFIFTVLGSDES